MPKIALIATESWYDMDEIHPIIRSITEWDYVTSEELKALRMYAHTLPCDVGSWRVVEQANSDFVVQSVKDALAKLQEDEAKRAVEKAKREAAKAKRDRKLAAKAKEAKYQTYLELQKEFSNA